jgi:CheY-like chemotaxis protein
MRIFILEDMQIRINIFKKWYEAHELVIVTNAEEAINILSKDLEWDVLFLDHDLGGKIFVSIKDENTGSRVAKFLCNKSIKGRIIIHSWNPVGAKNMLNYLSYAEYIPISSKENFGIK